MYPIFQAAIRPTSAIINKPETSGSVKEITNRFQGGKCPSYLTRPLHQVRRVIIRRAGIEVAKQEGNSRYSSVSCHPLGYKLQCSVLAATLFPLAYCVSTPHDNWANYRGRTVMSIVALLIGGFIIFIIVATVLDNWRLKRTVAHHRSRPVEEPTDETAQQVKRIVAENRAMSPEDIFMDMTLEDELGIAGDDASDLFQAFATKFPDVDLSNLDLSLYFSPEVSAPRVIGCPRRPLRVSDLVQAARDKRWQAE